MIWYQPQFLYGADLTDGGKGGARALLLLFTLVHIRIYSKSRFSIKTLPSNPLSCLTDQNKRRFWLIPMNCVGFALRLSVSVFESSAHPIYLLSWVSWGLIPSRIDFSIQLRRTALDSLCWVLMWVPPQSLVFPSPVALALKALTFFLFFCFD